MLKAIFLKRWASTLGPKALAPCVLLASLAAQANPVLCWSPYPPDGLPIYRADSSSGMLWSDSGMAFSGTAWVRYRCAPFEYGTNGSVLVRAANGGTTDATLTVRSDSISGPEIARITIPATGSWGTFQNCDGTCAAFDPSDPRARGIVYVHAEGSNSAERYVAVDWIKFSCKPMLHVTEPVRCTTLTAGSTCPIQWKFLTDTSIVAHPPWLRVAYTLDSGRTWVLVADYLPTTASPDGSCLWQVPDTVAAPVVVRVSSCQDPTVMDTSGALRVIRRVVHGDTIPGAAYDSAYRVAMTTAPLSYAQLDSTNWGWVKYSRVDFGSAGANKLVMRASGSRSEPLLKLSLAPDWTAPALAWADMVHHDAAESRVYTFPLLQRVTGEHDVYLRCRTCTPADTGVIDWLLLARDTTVAFRERLNIAYPALHWPVAARSHHLVVWDSLDLDPPLVDIDYASDTGRTWTSVARAIPNAGCYLWAAPDSPVGGCRIGVRATGSSEPMDVCHGLFDVVDSTRNPCEREIQLHTADNIYGGTRDRARWIGSLLRMNSAAWFQYSQVDFGSAGPHEAALTVNVSSLDSIALSFHIDMPDGPCVLACTLSSSQPDTLHHYTTFSYACAPGLSGVHDLYVRCPSCPITRVSTFLGGLKVCPAVAVSKPRTAERRTVQVVQQGDMLRISLAGAGPTSAAIFTLDGRLLWSRTSPSGANRAADGVWTVDCRRIGLPRGCYALRVESGPQRVVRVLTVSR